MFDRSSPLDERGMNTIKLPINERYSARYFDLRDVFTDLDIGEENFVEPNGITILALGKSIVPSYHPRRAKK